MTAEELRKVLDRLGVSQMEMSRALGVVGQSVRRWVKPGAKVPEHIAVFMWLLDSRPELVEVVGMRRDRIPD